jgi:hypothetical protein
MKKDMSKLFARVAITKGKVISQEIGEMLVKTFNNSNVARALRGQGGEDLPAHFGLSDGNANALVDGMGDLIRKSVRIVSQGGVDTASLRIQAVPDDWNEYLSLPGAQYISQPSNITIPVAKWLLIDPGIDIGQAAYDIVFEGEGDGFDARIQKVSRSGRAIMVSIEALGGGGGYVLPGIVAGQSGQNFIEFTLGQSSVATEAAAILMKKVR